MVPLRCFAPALLLSLVTACGGSSTSTESSTPPDSGQAAAATAQTESAADGQAVLHADVAAAAKGSDVSKMKLRLDDSGAIVKQSVYHGDASRIAEPVKALATKEYPDGKPVRFENEWYAEHGPVHEVEVELPDGTHCEVAAKPDGALLYKECRVDPAKLDAAVTAAVEAAIPGGKILEAETKQGDGIDTLTIEVEAGGKEYYLIMSPTGEVSGKYQRVPAIVEVPVP